jgi:hypothetical protein
VKVVGTPLKLPDRQMRRGAVSGDGTTLIRRSEHWGQDEQRSEPLIHRPKHNNQQPHTYNKNNNNKSNNNNTTPDTHLAPSEQPLAQSTFWEGVSCSRYYCIRSLHLRKILADKKEASKQTDWCWRVEARTRMCFTPTKARKLHEPIN